jgi:hypothetical protein
MASRQQRKRHFMNAEVSEIRGLQVMLRTARDLIDDVAYTFHVAGRNERAAKIRNLRRLIDDEICDLDRDLAQADQKPKGVE